MLLFSAGTPRLEVGIRTSQIQSGRRGATGSTGTDCDAFDRWRARWIPVKDRPTRLRGQTRPLARDGTAAIPFAPKIAERISRLGTETAFAVSAEAAAFGAEGHTIYPFHLGDLNIPTPSNVVEASFKSHSGRQDRLLPEAGIRQLRAAWPRHQRLARA